MDDDLKQIQFLARTLKAPRIQDSAARLAEQAREAGWSHEHYLAAVLDREVSARDASGANLRIRAAGFPARKTIEDFVFDHQPALKRDTIAHLAGNGYLAEAGNVVLLGPPGTGKTHLAVALGIKAQTPATGSCSRPRPNGSPGCRPLTSKDASRPSWPSCYATD